MCQGNCILIYVHFRLNDECMQGALSLSLLNFDTESLSHHLDASSPLIYQNFVFLAHLNAYLDYQISLELISFHL